MTYQNYASLAVNLNRQAYGPLDISQVFISQADLTYYITKGTVSTGVSDYWKSIVPYPYAGQVVALLDSNDNPTLYKLKKSGDIFVTVELAESSSVDSLRTQLTALINSVSGELSDHESDSEIHITNSERTLWNTVSSKYVKPTDGIPKSDLSGGVQASLGLADTALQEHQSLDEYRKANDQDLIDLGITNSVSEINSKIPDQATSSNQLADKSFVNSSIATNTATFRGTSAQGLTEEQFLAWANSLTKTNNDYVFWDTLDDTGNRIFKRYKYNGTTWMYEYTLNNSSFTSVQWLAINSGITASKVSDIDANTSARHTHENKSVIDGITSALISAWNSAVSWITTNGSNVLTHLSDSVKHITASERTTWNSKAEVSDIPTKLSELTDDLGSTPVHTHSQYLTQHQDISGKEDTSNKSDSYTESSSITYASTKALVDGLSTKSDTSHTHSYNQITNPSVQYTTTDSLNPYDKVFIDATDVDLIAFMRNTDYFSLYRSSDGGSTWTQDTAFYINQLLRHVAIADCHIGPTIGTVTTNFRSKICINPPVSAGYNGTVDKFVIQASTCAHDIRVNISYYTRGDSSTKVSLIQGVKLEGWPGYTVIGLPEASQLFCFGDGSDQVGQFEFEFYVNAVGAYPEYIPSILQIRTYGKSNWCTVQPQCNWHSNGFYNTLNEQGDPVFRNLNSQGTLSVSGNGAITGSLGVGGDVNATGNVYGANMDQVVNADSLATHFPSSYAVYQALPKDAIESGDAIQSGNPFRPGKVLHIDRLENAFYCANKRYNISAEYYDSQGTQTGTVTQSQLDSVFDGNFESSFEWHTGDTCKIHFVFGTHGSTEEADKFPGYPYGNIYLNFYYSAKPSSVTARVYDANQGWCNLAVYDISSSSTQNCWRIENDQQYYYVNEYEITIVGDTTNELGCTSVTEIEYVLDRPSHDSYSVVSKFGDESVYGDFSVNGIIDFTNKVKSASGGGSGITSASTDSEIPTAKAVYDYHDSTKETTHYFTYTDQFSTEDSAKINEAISNNEYNIIIGPDSDGFIYRLDYKSSSSPTNLVFTSFRNTANLNELYTKTIVYVYWALSYYMRSSTITNTLREVSANPTSASTDVELTGLSVGDTNYKITHPDISGKEDVSNKSDNYFPVYSSSTTYASTKALVDGLETKQVADFIIEKDTTTASEIESAMSDEKNLILHATSSVGSIGGTVTESYYTLCGKKSNSSTTVTLYFTDGIETWSCVYNYSSTLPTYTLVSTNEVQGNKSDSYTESSSTTYASTKALVDGLATKEGIGHITIGGVDYIIDEPTTSDPGSALPGHIVLVTG